MAESLEGTVALVTGASSGIGEATARVLALRGATVVLVARRRERLEAVVSEIVGAGGHAIAIEADLSLQPEAAAAVERTVEELGRLDILVNNAGVMLLGPAESAPLEEWERMVGINISGLMYTTHAALPHLVGAAEDSARGVADLVNVSSTAGRRAGPTSAAYNFTKFGVVGFSEGLRLEFTKQHLRVSVVEPGGTATELSSHIRPEVRAAAAPRFVGVERLEAEDVAEAIEFIVTRPRRVSVDELLVRPTNGL